MVKTLPFDNITVPSPGFGAMGLSFGLGSNLSLEEAEPVLLKAIALGCTFWDTAVSSLSKGGLQPAGTYTGWSRSCTKQVSMKGFSAISSGSTTSATRSSVRLSLGFVFRPCLS